MENIPTLFHIKSNGGPEAMVYSSAIAFCIVMLLGRKKVIIIILYYFNKSLALKTCVR